MTCCLFLTLLGAGFAQAATCEESDLNGDYDVNILDLIVVARLFGLSSGDIGYDPAADMNNDNTIDTTDLAEVSVNAGCFFVCPDNDNDGYTDQGCGGTDCDDDPAQCGSACYPGGTEICDNYDNDCDNTPDDGFAADDCSFVCSGMGFDYDSGRSGELRCCGDDSGEDSPYQSPETSCSDNRDNDCDGYTDADDSDCPSCTTLTGATTITSDTVLCPGTYYINDPSNSGAIRMYDNVVLDCNGATLIGDGRGYGIYLNYNDFATVKNCNVQNYQIGIYLYEASNNLITNNNVRDSWQRQDGDSGYGICLYKNLTKMNNISYNTLSDSFLGLYMVSSPENHVMRNTIQRCEYGTYTNADPYGSNAGNAFYNNVFCDNLISDIFNNVGPNNYGDYNTCSNVGEIVGGDYNWNDAGTTGCSYGCPSISNSPPTRGSCTATVSDLAVGAYYRKQNITCTYYDPDGYQDLRYMYIVMNYLSGDSSSCDTADDPDCGGAFRYLLDIDSFHKSPGEEMDLGNPWSELDASSSASCHGNQCDVSFIIYYPSEDFQVDGNDARILAWDKWWYSTSGIRTTQSSISSGPGTDNLFDTHIGTPYACSVIVEPGWTGRLDFGLSLDQPACLRIPNQTVTSASMDLTGGPTQETRDSQLLFDMWGNLGGSIDCQAFTPSEPYSAQYVAYREYATDDIRDARLMIRATNSSDPDFFVMDGPLAYCDIWNSDQGWNWCTLNGSVPLDAGTKYWACVSDFNDNPLIGKLAYAGTRGTSAYCYMPLWTQGMECIDTVPPDMRVGYHALSFMVAAAIYPESSTLDVGGDGDVEWTYSGALQSTETYNDASFASEINEYFAFNTTCGNPCLVPMDFSSATAGVIDMTNINVVQ